MVVPIEIRDQILSERNPQPDSLGSLLLEVVRLRWSRTKDGDKSAQRGAACVALLGVDTPLPIASHQVRDLTGQLVAAGLSGSTVNRYLASLSAILREAEDRDLGPAPRIRRYKEPEARERVVTDEEVALLTSGLAGLRGAPAALTLFLVDTGARVGEALKLTEADFRDGSVIFKDTKGAKPRRVPLTKRAALAADGLRWSGQSYSSFMKAFCKARDAAGITSDVTPHCLRHTFASRLLAKGVAIPTLQGLLGHADIATTMRYAHLETGALDRAIQELEDE